MARYMFVQPPQGCLSKECPNADKCGRFIDNVKDPLTKQSADYHGMYDEHAHCTSYSPETGYKEWDEYRCGPNANYKMFLEGEL